MAKRVIIVEDDVLLRKGIARVVGKLLEKADIRLETTRDAETAIRVILAGRNDTWLVISDQQMPGRMTGVQLCFALNDQWPPIQATKFLMSASHVDCNAVDKSGAVFVDKGRPENCVRVVKKAVRDFIAS